MSDLMLDVDQAGELKAAFRRGNWTNREIKRLCEGDILADVRNVILGSAVIEVLKPIVDCDADPFVPEGWKVEEHKKGGKLNLINITPDGYLHKGQRCGKSIQGISLRKELESQAVLNANVLDFYLAHPLLIPNDWKGYVVFFWGTIYRRDDDYVCIRALYWNGQEWTWHYKFVGDTFSDREPAAVSELRDEL